MYPKGVGATGLARYLQEANKEVEVWLQVREEDSSKQHAHAMTGTYPA